MTWIGRGEGIAGALRREAGLARLELRRGRFQRSMAAIAGLSAVVSGFEAYVQHQRGAFSHWLMWTPVWLTPPTVLATIAAVFSKRAARILLPVIALASLVDGVIGFIYHLKGIRNLPGGFRLGQYNVVMGPPIFAPLLTCMTGVLALIGSLLRRERFDIPLTVPARRQPAFRRSGPVLVPRGLTARISHGEFQRTLALISAAFAVLAGGEAYFEHLRGSFNQRIMWTPIWITPVMVVAGVGAALSRKIAHLVLPVVSVVTLLDGFLGFLLHLRGIGRMPGGFDNLRFNLTLGPPMFAPLLFSSVGLLGLIATILRRKGGAR